MGCHWHPGRVQVQHSKGLPWGLSCLTLLVTWSRWQSTLSSGLWMAPDWEDQTVHLGAGLPSRGTWADWRDGPTGTFWSSARTDAKSCSWEGRIPFRDTGWEMEGLGRAALWERPWEYDGGCEPGVHPGSKGGQQHPVLYHQAHNQQIKGSDCPLFSTC